MTPHFVTYFDSHYAAQGIAMLQSLRTWCPGAAVTVLCLDDTMLHILRTWFPCGVKSLTIAQILELESRLVELQASRTPWEFYATTKPLVIRHVMEAEVVPDDWVAFLDADTYFFSSPREAFAEIPAHASTVLSPHRFSHENSELEKYGTYNAGFGLWRHDALGKAVLADWTARCLEWCFNRVEDGRFMNQAYLNAWPQEHEGVMVLTHPGFNLAPWNLGGHVLQQSPEGMQVDEEPLVFFHFSSVSRRDCGTWQTFYTNPEMSQCTVLDGIYEPYLRQLEIISERLMRKHGIAGVGTQRKVDPTTPMLVLRSP
ncbi:hypothetical protein [Roseimicrobium sp. ORNL1]|uniref:hypothetical protein n=1 Tax=Roseimicrobium sp. ORNL1 TaxID=2711231 RepID=UPI0013E1C198|nr:hypothetical protein [Roseimicrobium sp. ORNL1]QIF04663.1 hypothetical protein G5S37_25080 [Roseimicrobium sp. ORNL1]